MSAPIEMRRYLAIMYGKEPIKSAKKDKVEETKKDMTMRDMLGKMRVLNEGDESMTMVEPETSTEPENGFIDNPDSNAMSLGSNNGNENELTTKIDKEKEEKKMKDYFNENTIVFNNFSVFGKGVLLSGTIDGQIQFVFTLTHNENKNGVKVNYLDDFKSSNPKNEEIVKKLNSYDEIFSKYWRDQLFKQ